MNTYIALLRGINVGGNKVIRMPELKALFESLELRQVRTYIQSGNVVFECAETAAGPLARALEEKIAGTFGFGASVLIRSREELEAAAAANPYPLAAKEDYKRLYVSFLEQEPSADALERLMPYAGGPDKLTVVGRELYTLYEASISKSPLFKVRLDQILGTDMTTRNWNTVTKLAEMAREKG
ncbi:DUF1697 domain-containing protein ['Paenibacillus yunnanensis' Narsing Rao et al. 2020]|uniref:DUF1697 domain-containing protein n=1 Tax=Paenibacillus tengchongensis TaxID=2608684 RepID=UPI00124E4F64|nr:DUF1697 domain-containing protein [Paenibacillus tengchongensis]